MEKKEKNRVTKNIEKNYIRKMKDEDRDRIRDNVIKHTDLSLKDVEREERKKIEFLPDNAKEDRNKEVYEDYLKGFDHNSLAMKYGVSRSRITKIIKEQKERDQLFTDSEILNELVEKTDTSSALIIQKYLKRAGISTIGDFLKYRGRFDCIPGIGPAYLSVLESLRDDLFVITESASHSSPKRKCGDDVI